MSPSGYVAEITNLSPKAEEKDVYDFFSFCGAIDHVETVRSGEYGGAAYVTFRDAYALETAVLLSGAKIRDQYVCIMRHGQQGDDFHSWKIEDARGAVYALHADAFVNTPTEAVVLATEIVKTMVAKGYVLSKDAYFKAKAFDESYKVSANAAARIAEMSKSIGLTDKILYVDEQYRVSATTKTIIRTASAASTTVSGAATAAVNSSYFAKGALLVSDVLFRAAEAAAKLGGNGNKS